MIAIQILIVKFYLTLSYIYFHRLFNSYELEQKLQNIFYYLLQIYKYYFYHILKII